MARKYKSDIARAMHSTMTDLHEIGAVDKTTMREFDRMCLTKTEKLAAAEIREHLEPVLPMLAPFVAQFDYPEN